MKVTGTILTVRDDVKTDPYVFAMEKHAGQLYGDKPYIVHLEEVFTIVYDALSHLGSDPYLDHDAHVFLIAALLHDVVEDCYDDRAAGMAEILELFGEDVATAVEYLTDLDGVTRVVRKAKFFARMDGIFGPRDHRFTALVVKVADRLANMRTGLRDGRKDKLTMYLKEMPHFLHMLTMSKYNSPLIEPLYLALIDVRDEAKEFTGFEY